MVRAANKQSATDGIDLFVTLDLGTTERDAHQADNDDCREVRARPPPMSLGLTYHSTQGCG